MLTYELDERKSPHNLEHVKTPKRNEYEAQLKEGDGGETEHAVYGPRIAGRKKDELVGGDELAGEVVSVDGIYEVERESERRVRHYEEASFDGVLVA